jgi:hypothetical protein
MLAKDLVDAFGKVVAALAFLFAVTTYFLDARASRDERRAENSFSRIDIYRDQIAPIEIAFDLHMRFYSVHLDINDQSVVGPEEFQEIAEEVFSASQIVLGGQQSSSLFSQFVRAQEFYSEVQICAQEKHCSAGIVQSFLCPRATEFAVEHARLLDFYSRYLRPISSGQRKVPVEAFVDWCE